MTAQASESLLSKVRGLLAKAENPACTPAEAAAYNDKAAELIAKYGIDRAMVAASDPTTDVVGDRIIPVEAPYALDKAGLLGRIADALRCRPVQIRKWRNGGYAYDLHLFGFGSDLERVELLYTSLLVQASYGLAVARPAGEWESVAAYRRSWLMGFSREVTTRLLAAERAATAAESARQSATAAPVGSSVELVLVDRQAAVSRAVEDTYPRLKPGRVRSLGGSGYREGRAAGARADLGGSRLGGASRTGAIGGRA